MSTKNDNNVRSGTEYYGSVMRRIRDQAIVNEAVKMQSKSIELIPRDDMAEKLGISTAVLSRAFKDKEEESDQIDQLKNVVMKSLGIATPLVLLETNAIEKISEFVSENKIASGLLGSMYLFWSQFIQPRIDDPKNDLSEIEVFTKLWDSQASKVYLSTLLASITLPQLLKWFEKQIGLVMGSIGEIFGVPQVIENFIPDTEEMAAAYAVASGNATDKQRKYVECVNQVNQSYNNVAAKIFAAKVSGEYDRRVDECQNS